MSEYPAGATESDTVTLPHAHCPNAASPYHKLYPFYGPVTHILRLLLHKYTVVELKDFKHIGLNIKMIPDQTGLDDRISQ